MNGQRFHQQKRIEMKTGQCERSLTDENSDSAGICARVYVLTYYIWAQNMNQCNNLDRGKFEDSQFFNVTYWLYAPL